MFARRNTKKETRETARYAFNNTITKENGAFAPFETIEDESAWQKDILSRWHKSRVERIEKEIAIIEARVKILIQECVIERITLEMENGQASKDFLENRVRQIKQHKNNVIELGASLSTAKEMVKIYE